MEETILIVDDDTNLLSLMVEYLSKFNDRVLRASDGVQALELLEKEHVSLLLTDIRMPRMNGFELVKVAKEKYPRLGVIIMTAFTSIYTEGDIREIGVDDYVTKPFNLSVLQEKIDRVFLQIRLLKQKGSGEKFLGNNK